MRKHLMLDTDRSILVDLANRLTNGERVDADERWQIATNLYSLLDRLEEPKTVARCDAEQSRIMGMNLADLYNDKASVRLELDNRYSCNDCKWYITVTKEQDGVSVKAEARDEDVSVAILDACTKFYNVINRGAPQLLAAITYAEFEPDED